MTLTMTTPANPPSLQAALFRPGMRIAVACSGGADSVALLRVLLEQRGALGLVLSVAHVNHGIRGAASDEDQIFVEALCTRFGLPFHTRRVDTPSSAKVNNQGLEEAARNLRYAWFWELLAAGEAEAIVTAHTLGDQSETVLHRLIRGAWTEGLGGIHPVLRPPAKQPGLILRPFLATGRGEIEAWLQAIGQPWREDATNRDTTFTRNRLRHELLPALATYNPGIQRQLSQLATLARDEEAYWQAELARLLPSLLLLGKPVRGGGRATGTVPGEQSLAIEIERLRPLPPALRRRVLRAAAARLGFALDFDDTERLIVLCGLSESDSKTGPDPYSRHGLKLQIAKGLRAERTPRELRLLQAEPEPAGSAKATPVEYLLPIPGAVEAPAFGIRLEVVMKAAIGNTPGTSLQQTPLPEACLRAARPGDRVTLRHTRSPMKIREAFKRARLPEASAAGCPVLEWEGEIIWVSGLTIEPQSPRAAAIAITATPLGEPPPPAA